MVIYSSAKVSVRVYTFTQLNLFRCDYSKIADMMNINGH